MQIARLDFEVQGRASHPGQAAEGQFNPDGCRALIDRNTLSKESWLEHLSSGIGHLRIGEARNGHLGRNKVIERGGVRVDVVAGIDVERHRNLIVIMSAVPVHRCLHMRTDVANCAALAVKPAQL